MFWGTRQGRQLDLKLVFTLTTDHRELMQLFSSLLNLNELVLRKTFFVVEIFHFMCILTHVFSQGWLERVPTVYWGAMQWVQNKVKPLPGPPSTQ